MFCGISEKLLKLIILRSIQSLYLFLLLLFFARAVAIWLTRIKQSHASEHDRAFLAPKL